MTRTRPGLLRTDTVKKEVANGALLSAADVRQPYVILTSHVPESGSAAAMLATASRLGYVSDVICVYVPEDAERLRSF